jgi:peptidoglycan/LPS O-acetylase OafA/YrhL
MVNTHRVDTLDGWRGIAILLVLFDHIQVALTGHYLHPWMQTGQHGVTIFFVLSGYLITFKLLEGPIDLKRFYLRRFFRLMPAAWTYLAVLLLLNRLTGVQLTSGAELRACLLFYRNNVQVPGLGLAGHFWSLSLEEQFYLLWPSLLLLAGSKRCRWIAALGACACAAYRWISWPHNDRLGPNDSTLVRADALLIGCLLALALSDERMRFTAIRWAKTLALPALAVFLVCVARFHWLPPLHEDIAIAFLLSATVLYPGHRWSRLLSFRPLAWLGVISYSIYIWQELFMHIRSLYTLVALPLVAVASYYLIERPCVRVGRRLGAPARPINEYTSALPEGAT